MYVPVSSMPTPWAVLCPMHGKVYLAAREYENQLLACDDLWKCPICGRVSEFDDENYDARSE